MYYDSSNAFDTSGAPIASFDTSRASVGFGHNRQHSHALSGFRPGTVVLTKNGMRLVETLRVGDQILTRDNGFQTLRWFGYSKINTFSDRDVIQFDAGTIGNTSTLFLSRKTQILVPRKNGAEERLVLAQDLINAHSIRAIDVGETDLVSLVFDRHEIIFANGASCETLRVTRPVLYGMVAKLRSNLIAHLPLLGITDRAYRQTARPLASL